MLENRSITPFIVEDLKRKMVLLSGPRQCGKTTLARKIGKALSSKYYNWDIDRDRKQLLRSELDESSRLWMLDEIHKNRRWRNWLKGLFDEHSQSHAILVAGSAQLELYARGGDSLQGRYFHHHLFPLTVAELESSSHKFDYQTPTFDRTFSLNSLASLLRLGGFPEPFFSSSLKQANRWRSNYSSLLVREEVRSVEQTQDLDRMELLYDRLSLAVGSPLSINSLREDLEVAFNTAKKWIGILERLYGVFRIYPYGSPKIKAVKKEAKLYFFDWAKPESDAAKFENIVAVHLLKLVQHMIDIEGIPCDLRYLRNEEGKEVDFIVLKKNHPWLMIEVKWKEQALDPNLFYFSERVPCENIFQICFEGNKDFQKDKIRLMPASKFFPAWV